MMTGCGKFEDAILDLVYGELDDADAASLRTHAADCPACAAAVSEMSAMRRLSSQAVILTPPAAIDAVILGEARASAPVSDAARVIRPAVDDRPGFFDLLRAWLLHPAFSGAVVVALILTVTFFISEKATSPKVSPTSVETVIAERPLEIVGAAPAAENAEAEERSRDIKDQRDERNAKNEATPNSAVVTAEPETIAAPTESKQAAGTPSGKSGLASRRSKSAASGGAPARKPAASIPYSAPKGAPSSKSAGAGYTNTAPDGDVLGEAPAEMDDMADFAPPPAPTPAKKKSAYAEEAMSEESEALFPSPSQSAGAGASAPGSSDAYTRGMDAYRRGDCNTASAELAIVAASPSSYPGQVPSAVHHLARCEKRSGRCARAVNRYEDLINRYPAYSGRGDAMYEAASCYKRLGRTDKARSMLQLLETIPGWGDRAREAAAEL